MKKEKQSKAQKKGVGVMPESKEGELHSDKVYTIVTNQKQAIALSESETANVGK